MVVAQGPRATVSTVMTDDECGVAAAGDGSVCALLMDLAASLDRGWPLWRAMPHAFFVAGHDTLHAFVRLGAQPWRISALLSDLLPPNASALLRQGERDAELVCALRRAARLLEHANPT